MVYAYAVCPTDAPPPRRRGLGGARLRVVRCDGVAAVYSRHRSLRPAPTTANVLAHERIVEALMAQGPVLPFRFATRIASPAQLGALLQERGDALRRALERVRERVEVGVRALPRPPADAPPATAAADAERGRRYLLARVARQRRAEHAARALHEPLAGAAVACVLDARPAPPAAFAAAYLVEAAELDAFRARVAAAAAELEGFDVFLTGPLPPYNFVDEPADAHRR